MRQHFIFHRIDPVLLGLTLALSMVGIGVIHSAGSGTRAVFAARQVYWLMVAVACYFLGFFISRKHLVRAAYHYYAAMMAVLVTLAIYGKAAGGVQRWIRFGGMTFQPSELAKITLLLALARYFHDRKQPPPYGLEEIAVPLLLVAGYAVPVAMQPDLGTAMFLVMISVPLFLFIGVRPRAVITLIAGAGAAAPFLFFSLKDYQRERILNFFSPERDPLGTGYHVVQSKIAIGSGGFLGKGYMLGTQSQLHFIPEQHTDFIISVLGEEFGFLGVLVVIGVMFFLSLWLLSYLEFARSRFATLLIVGIACSFALQAVINMAMTIGVLPVVGLPLPLISYGGSSLVTTWFAFGIVAGYRRRW